MRHIGHKGDIGLCAKILQYIFILPFRPVICSQVSFITDMFVRQLVQILNGPGPLRDV